MDENTPPPDPTPDDKRRAYKRAWRAAHPLPPEAVERARVKAIAYYHAHKEERREYSRAYAIKNREKIRLKKLERRLPPDEKENRSTSRREESLRRAAERRSTGRKCAKCGEWKRPNAFPRDSSRADGLFSYCCLCHRAYQSKWATENPEEADARYQRAVEKARAWKAANPEEYKNLVRRSSLLRRYGITPEQYGQRLAEQNGHCALCDRTPEMEKHGVLCVDHDHACCPHGKGCGFCVRWLLCFNHNVMLGVAHDRADVLRAAADLLDAWNRHRVS